MSDDVGIVAPDMRGASGSSFVNLPAEKLKTFFIAVLLALSICTNVALVYAYRDKGTEERLYQYNLDWFKANQFSDLKGRVEVIEKLFDEHCHK
jgi:hypothetical protein